MTPLEQLAKDLVDHLRAIEPQVGRGQTLAHAALRSISSHVEVVTPHREEDGQRCNGEWTLVAPSSTGARLVCEHAERGLCFGTAYIPEALLVSLVEAKEGSR